MSQPKITGPRLIGGIVTCKLCDQRFADAPKHLLISAGQSDQKNMDVADFCTQLLEHFVTKHPRQNLALEMEGTQFLSMRRLQNFRVNDPEIAETVDKLRWQIHNATAVATLTDLAIAGAADQYADGMIGKIAEHIPGSALNEEVPRIKTALREILMEMLTSTRDLLQEPNKYPPQITH